ncbi:sensor histidine kinase [[Phormidium] sp. LEGE 05292]|uniref:sensor histidine kinase n=1 Tax=[Phormidium] sp. LEGE 05292 TaxID=767427 RepID=UPI001D14ACBF|nr:ATP-binding protein [Phormidium sp. LEGE 05292]
MNSNSPMPGHQKIAHHSRKFWANKFNLWKDSADRLSISTKIRCGYALALGIAVLGTTVGIGLGHYYEEAFREEAEEWHEAGLLLNDLQIAVGQARSHQQQFVALLEKPEDFQNQHSHFIEYILNVKLLLQKTKTSLKVQQIPASNVFFTTYEQVVENYFTQTESVIKKINSTNLKPTEISQLQQSLLNLTISETALKFDDYSMKLAEIASQAFREETTAANNVERSEELQIGLTMSSMLVSVILAIFLAIYTSRAIARPLKATTEVAQKVTQEDNFDLQAPVTTSDEVGVLSVSLNQLISRVKYLLAEQKAAATRQEELQQKQLLQSEKMSSLGRMVAGIAHEINNPVNFIYGNLVHASEYVSDLLDILASYEQELTQPSLALQEKAEEIDLEFLEEDLPKTLQSMTVGAERIRQIVLSLKDFSRLDEAEAQLVDLHACINSTLLILHNRIKKGIKVVLNYGDIPKVLGYTGFLYQVFMNLISNAIDSFESHSVNDALAETLTTENSSDKELLITTERLDSNWVMVRIADNGCGISLENQSKIFDTFFTTKPRGIGTGLGLAITRQIVEEKHGGKITCTSEIGKGTEFAIALPIDASAGKVNHATAESVGSL